MIDGEPWFYALDVCAALTIQDVSDVVERISEDEKMKYTLHLTGIKSLSGQEREIWLLNEFGVYEVIFRVQTIKS